MISHNMISPNMTNLLTKNNSNLVSTKTTHQENKSLKFQTSAQFLPTQACINNHLLQCITHLIWFHNKVKSHEHTLNKICTTCKICILHSTQAKRLNVHHQQMYMNFFSQFWKSRKIPTLKKNQSRLPVTMIKMLLILSAKCLGKIVNLKIMDISKKEKSHGVDS